MSSRPKGFEKAMGDYHRPRRPSAETIRYLRSLPLDLTTSLAEIRAFLDAGNDANAESTVEYPPSLAVALSALDEIGNEIASLAGEEHASEATELLVRITAPFSAIAARKLLASCAGYAVFLATHRYGSHVLQTILQFSVTAETTQDLALHEDAPVLGGVEELPTLSESLLLLHSELMPQASHLAVHVCGSHILRTMCCIFGGFEQKIDQTKKHMSSRRGGKSKAKQVDKVSTSTDMRLDKIQHSRLEQDDAAIAGALDEIASAVSGSEVCPPGALQQMACDSSASPLLMVLLRVLTYRDARDDVTTPDKASASPSPDHHLAMVSPEPHFREGSAAEALAHRLLCWQSQKSPSSQNDAGDVIYGLSGEPRGSHILDTLFRLSSDSLYESILNVGGFSAENSLPDYIEHDVSNFVVQTILATIRNREQALKISEILRSNATLIVDAEKRRRGILWRWAEMAVKYSECQKQFLEGLASALEKLQPGAKLSKECARVLLAMKVAPDQDRLILNVEGTRSFHHLLRFKDDVVRPFAESLLALSADDLERLARDGLGSRCVWDVILEVESNAMVGLRKKLLAKLSGRWVALATDRVGHHVVRKLFSALPETSSRVTMVKELSEGSVRLEGNAMGRNIASFCKIREYTTRGRSEWERSVGKAFEEKAWLEDMVQPSQSNKGQTKKVKRQQEEVNEGSQEKSKRIKEMSMGDILQAITMPKTKR